MKAKLAASVLVLFLALGTFALMPGGALAEVGDLTLASSTAGGAAGASSSDSPVISANGRYAAFTTWSANFPGSNGSEQVYRKDLSTGAISLVSCTLGGGGRR